MEFAVEQRVEKDVTVVKVTGEIDVFSSPRLREMLLDVIETTDQRVVPIADGRPPGRPAHLVIDLGDVTFLDSTGLGVLVGIYHRLRGRGGSMSFVGANDRVRRVFHVTQLTKIFVLHNSLDEAVRAIETADAESAPGGSSSGGANTT